MSNFELCPTTISKADMTSLEKQKFDELLQALPVKDIQAKLKIATFLIEKSRSNLK